MIAVKPTHRKVRDEQGYSDCVER